MPNVKLLINSKDYPNQKPNDLTVVLDEELSGVTGIKLTHIKIPITFYNISKELKNFRYSFGYSIITTEIGHSSSFSKAEVQTGLLFEIPEGLYDFNSFTKTFYSKVKELRLPNEQPITFDLDKATGKVKINLNKDYTLLPENYFPNLKPFSYFVIHCDLLDTSCNLYNGKRSDILTSVLVKKCRFNEILEYNLIEDFKKCDNQFNKLKLQITDEFGNPIKFNHGNIQYTLDFSVYK